MHRSLLLPLGLLIVGTAMAGGARLPADAARLASRIDACVHFAGEFNGDRSERDRDVSRRMAELRCGDVARDAARMRRRYPHDAAVQHAMDAASEL